jgi:predicted nucleic acid-binding protein
VLYLDSSALIKHYVRETGTGAVDDKLRVEEEAARPILTSVLTFAEIHAALARRARDKSLSTNESVKARAKFDFDWASGLSPVDLGPAILGIVCAIVDSFSLKGAEAVHLASALLIRSSTSIITSRDSFIFLTSDKQLARAAAQSGLDIFNPETSK